MDIKLLELSNKTKVDKIKIVVLSDGYDDSEKDEFKKKCKQFIAALTDEAWYKDKISSKKNLYPNLDQKSTWGKKFFEVIPVFVASDESGVGISKKCEGYNPLSVNNSFGSRFCHGRNLESEGKVPFRILRGDVEKVKKHLYAEIEWDYVLVLANTKNMDKTFELKSNTDADKGVKKSEEIVNVKREVLRGGYADVSNRIAWASANSNDWYDLAMHEFGHVVFDLHEEYEYFSGQGGVEEYLDDGGISESNIIPTLRVENLLEALRKLVLVKHDIRHIDTSDGKDYLIEEKDKGDFIKHLGKEIEVNDIGLSAREKDWFYLIHEGKTSELFTFKELKDGPFKRRFVRINMNVYWRRYGSGSTGQDDKTLRSDEATLYHRTKQLRKAIDDNRVGFYEGAGTFPFGMARPVWACRMRETRCDNRKEEEEKYYRKIENHVKNVQLAQDRIRDDHSKSNKSSDCSDEDSGEKFEGSIPDFTDLDKKANRSKNLYCEVCMAAIHRKLNRYALSNSLSEPAIKELYPARQQFFDSQ